MIDIKQKEQCVGCGACVQICPCSVLILETDHEGFQYPSIKNSNNCINCGLCKETCPATNSSTRKSQILNSYAGYVHNEKIRELSSSGGLFGIMASEIIENGGIVFGATMNKNQEVFHVSVDNLEDLPQLQGSKYQQSQIGNTYAEAKGFLNSGRLVLFSGTPCQIAGLKKFLNREYDNLYTVDILCHGVPSPKVWKKYITWHESERKSEVIHVSFRKKNPSWKNFHMQLQFKNSSIYNKVFYEDPFMRMFLSNICLRPSCYRCKFKSMNRYSDITLGDAWGIKKIFPELDDDKGTSIIITHTPKGDLFINKFHEITIKQTSLNRILPPSADSRISVAEHPNRKKLFSDLNHEENWEFLMQHLNLPFPKKVKRKIQVIIRKTFSNLLGNISSH